jgi:hypothetical protein
MMIQVPSDEELAAMLAQHAHRFPVRASIPVLGDAGERMRLPLLLGVPSGACRMPAGSRSSPVWKTIVSSILEGSFKAAVIAEHLANDCVLWPDQRICAEWRERWPAIPNDIALAVLRLVGAEVAALGEPSPLEEPPKAIEEVLLEHPRAVWRHMRPRDEAYEVVIECPDAVRYDAFSDAIGRADADAMALCREFAEAQVMACVSKASSTPVPLGKAFDPHPGLVILVASQARRLGGAQAEVRLGEW